MAGDFSDDMRLSPNTLSDIRRNITHISVILNSNLVFTSRTLGRLISEELWQRIEESSDASVTAELKALKGEAEKGLPIVLMVHTPLYSPDAYEKVLALYHNRPPVCLMSVPEEFLGCYSPYRYEQQKEDAATHEAYAYILGEPAIRLVLAGHLHEDAETMLTDRLPQIVTGIGTARRIRFR